METPTKQNSLYLTIKQVYFDQIIAGTKTEEYRDNTVMNPNGAFCMWQAVFHLGAVVEKNIVSK